MQSNEVQSAEANLRWRIGDVTVTRIVESAFEGLEDFIPDATPAAVLPIDWLRPHFITPEGVLRFSIHALVIEAGDRRIIVDTCVGNDKPRAFFPIWDRLQTDFLARLERAGFPPDSIDTVLCTHLHLDHVGWNTRRVDGEWVPTFPRARHLIQRSEYEFMEAGSRDATLPEWSRAMNAAVLDDSVRPVVAAGLVDLVDGDHRLCEEVRLVPTPGHTIGHASVRIESGGESALITGDFVHHPCQLAHPEWMMPADYDAAAAVRTRHAVFDALADTPTLVIGTHWPAPTAGRIARAGAGYRLDTDPC